MIEFDESQNSVKAITKMKYYYEQSKLGMIGKKKEASNSKERSMQLHRNYLEKRKGIQSPLARVSFRKGLLM